MKRIICAWLVVALVLPATSAARARTFHGRVDPGGTVEFEAKIRRGKLVRVRGSPHHPGFTWGDLPIECGVGGIPSNLISGHLPFSIEVEGHRFQARGSNGHAVAKLRGRFSRHGRRARGILRVHGEFPRMNAWGCDTGRAHWSAHRVPG